MLLFKAVCNHWQNYLFISCVDTTFEHPLEWTTMKDSDNLVVVPVKSSDPEYSNIIYRFHEQVGKRK